MISILARQVLSQQHLQKNYATNGISLKRAAESNQEWGPCKKLAKPSSNQTAGNDPVTRSVGNHEYRVEAGPWWWHTQRNRATKNRAKTMAERLREYRACKKAFLTSVTKLNRPHLVQVPKTPVRDQDQVVKVKRVADPLTNSPPGSVIPESVRVDSVLSLKVDKIDRKDFDSFNNYSDEKVSRLDYDHSYGMNVKQDNAMDLDASRISPNVFIKEEFRNSGAGKGADNIMELDTRTSPNRFVEEDLGKLAADKGGDNIMELDAARISPNVFLKAGDNVMELDAARTSPNVFVGQELLKLLAAEKAEDCNMELDASRVSPDGFLKAEKVGDSIMELDATDMNTNGLVEEDLGKSAAAREEYYKTLTRIATEEHAKKMHLMDVQLEFYKRILEHNRFNLNAIL